MNPWIYFGVSNGLGVLFCIIFITIGLIFYKNKTYEEKLKPIQFVYILLIILEIIKITYHVTVKDNFPTSRLPFVFCSFTMYAYPIICYLKKDHPATRVCYSLSIIPSLVIGGLYLFVFPDVSNASEYSFIMNLHSRFYHFVMFGGALYMLLLNMYDFRFKDFYLTATVCGTYIVLCTFFSLIVGGDLSYFGPMSGPLKSYYEFLGYANGNIIIIIAIYIVGFIIYYLINYIKNKKTINNISPHN